MNKDNSLIETQAMVIAKEDNHYLLQLMQTPCNHSTQHCCGGYCGSLLWQKIFSKNQTNQKTYLYSNKKFPIGSLITLSLSYKNVLMIQMLLWLFPTLIFLAILYLLPSQGLSLLIAICLSSILWLLMHHGIKKYHFGLSITPNAHPTDQESTIALPKKTST